FNRAFQEWGSGSLACTGPGVKRQAVGLQGLERGSRSLLNRRVIFLDRGKRLTQFLAHPRRCLVHSSQHMLAAVGLDLLASQRVSAAAVHRAQTEGVVAAKTGD